MKIEQSETEAILYCTSKDLYPMYVRIVSTRDADAPPEFSASYSLQHHCRVYEVRSSTLETVKKVISAAPDYSVSPLTAEPLDKNGSCGIIDKTFAKMFYDVSMRRHPASKIQEVGKN